MWSTVTPEQSSPSQSWVTEHRLPSGKVIPDPGMLQPHVARTLPLTDQLTALLELLDLEKIEVNLFRGHSPDDRWQRVFGGQVIGQALVAASRTVEERSCHSLHAYFLRPGDPKVPILYEVDRARDGRSFTSRRVVAIQHGKQIFNLAASFQIHEQGLDHQLSIPEVPGPEGLANDVELHSRLAGDFPEKFRAYFSRSRPIELRPVAPLDLTDPAAAPPVQDVWFRVIGSLSDDPSIHQCALAYMSDMTLLDTTTNPHAINFLNPRLQAASLDPAVWFHRPFRADEWLLYSQDSPSASGARGFARGSVFDQSGALVASMAQEGLIRVHD